MPKYYVDVAPAATSWYKDSKMRILHREDGPAVEWSDGSRQWYLDGQLHREGGPAVEWPDGSRHWWVEGDLHREDGPAVEHPDGDREWYLNGVKLTEEEFVSQTQPATELTVAEIERLLGKRVKIVK